MYSNVKFKKIKGIFAIAPSLSVQLRLKCEI